MCDLSSGANYCEDVDRCLLIVKKTNQDDVAQSFDKNHFNDYLTYPPTSVLKHNLAELALGGVSYLGNEVKHSTINLEDALLAATYFCLLVAVFCSLPKQKKNLFQRD
eukprot:GHVT01099672.1.p1 GENE.GHVT01099672.1~~GHVT01099672.1.p1  ORF type:complete len:108 (+),score=10.95 GHVT01099672.1:1417-1740(+)